MHPLPIDTRIVTSVHYLLREYGDYMLVEWIPRDIALALPVFALLHLRAHPSKSDVSVSGISIPETHRNNFKYTVKTNGNCYAQDSEEKERTIRGDS